MRRICRPLCVAFLFRSFRSLGRYTIHLTKLIISCIVIPLRISLVSSGDGGGHNFVRPPLNIHLDIHEQFLCVRMFGAYPIRRFLRRLQVASQARNIFVTSLVIDFRRPPRNRWELRSSAILRSI
jgi:hypothetical protein